MSFFFHLLGAGGGVELESFYVSESGDGVGTEIDPFGLTELQAALATIPSGSNIYFNKGDTFDLSLTIPQSLTIDSYGTGAKPIIYGSIDIGAQSWTHDGSNIYYTTYTSAPKGLFINGVSQTLSQTPFINITNRPTTTSISASQATLDTYRAGGSLVGAGIIAKEFGFRPTFQRTITADNGTTTLTFNAVFQNNNAPASGYGFRLLNKKHFITNVGDWSYDAAAQRIYVKTSGASPAGTNIRVSVNDYGFVPAPGVSNISISNLDFKHQYLGGIYSVSNNNIEITNCTFSDIIVHGIDLRGNSTGVNVSGNTINRINNNAINVGGIQGGTISNNIISSIGEQVGISIPYYVDWFRSVGCGIHLRWDIAATISVPCNIVVENNTIDDVGYLGIVFCGTDNIIRYNKIDTYCTKWNDGGGIYCINRPYGSGYATEDCLIYKNIILNGIGSLEGVIAESILHAEGIYIDNASTRITVDNNVVENTPDIGILCNFDTSNNTVTNNTVVGFTNVGIVFKQNTTFNYGPFNPDWSITFVTNVGNICTGNIVAGRSSTQYCIGATSENADSSYNPFVSGGDCDNNKYVNPYTTNIARHVGATTVLYNLVGWRTKISDEAASYQSPLALSYEGTVIAATDVLLTLNYTNADVSFSTPVGYTDIDGVDPVTQTIPAYSGVISLFGTELIFRDTFTGASGNLSGHTPDLGTAWNIPVGTVSLNGSGRISASVVGEIYKDVSNNNVIVSTVGTCSANGAINILLRYTDTNNYIQVQIVFDVATPANRVYVLINRVAGVNTIIASGAYASVINTDFTLTAIIKNNRVRAQINGVQVFDVTDTLNLNIGINNPSGTRHGLRLPLVSSYDSFSISLGVR